MRECNADHPVLLPIRPIARGLCDLWEAIPETKFGAVILFGIYALLLFISYVITKNVTETFKDLLFETIEDSAKRIVVVTLAQWAIQLVITNSSFFLVRYLLAGVAYAAFELGRDAVFSILLTLLCGSIIVVGYLLYSEAEPLMEFIDNHRFLFLELISAWAVTLWYWQRYIIRGRNNRTVFDHEIGAVLVRLRR